MAPKVNLSAHMFERKVQLAVTAFNKLAALIATVDGGSGAAVAVLTSYQNKADTTYKGIETFIDQYLEAEILPEGLTVEAVMETATNMSDHYDRCTYAIAPSLLSKPDSITPIASSTGISRHSTSFTLPANLSLPQLGIPTFHGEFHKWNDFIGQFRSIIHDCAYLTDIQRLQRLKEALKFPADKLISHLELTEANYQVAMDILHERFNQPNRLQLYHCDGILKLTPLSDRSTDLRSFIDTYNQHANALKSVVKGNISDSLHSMILLSKLNQKIKHRFQSTRTGNTDFPKPDEIIKFLTTYAQNEEAANCLNEPSANFTPRSKPKSDKRPVSLVTDVSDWTCSFCKAKGHALFKCSKFISKSPQERLKIVQNLTLCINCFGKHPKSLCKNPHRCHHCGQSHHTLLHLQRPKSPQQTGTTRSTNTPIDSTPVTKTHSVNTLTTNNGTVSVLPTAFVKISTSKDNFIIVRAILDSASTTSIATSRCCQALKAKRVHNAVNLMGIGSTQTKSLGSTYLTIATTDGEHLITKHPFVVLSQITINTPSMSLDPKIKTRIGRFQLADPSFDVRAPVDLLLGADVTASVILGSAISLGPTLPFLVPTRFGHVVMGQAPVPSTGKTTTYGDSQLPHPADLVSNHVIHQVYSIDVSANTGSTEQSCSNDDLHRLLTQFWEVESVPDTKQSSPDDVACEKIFQNTTERTTSGRYMVSLPFKQEPSALGDSYQIALKRFLLLERKFVRDPNFKSLYTDFMSDYLAHNHMTLASSPAVARYFIPHHGIFKSHGDSKKIRVVFDASAKTTSGLSLNDVLHSGPKLQTLLSDVLSLFRQYRYVFTCDIQQMFRQILVCPQHQVYQAILWRDSPDKPIQVYMLTTVTYGVTTSPYLALRTLAQLVQDEGRNHPKAAQILRHNIFVDDIVAGASAFDETIDLLRDVIALLKRGGFTLKKWSSNNPKILSTINDCDKEPLVTTPFGNMIGLLGMKWSPEKDVFIYNISLKPHVRHAVLTKRIVLSELAQLYDPCGWLAPVLFVAKSFLQRLWLHPFDWDTPLPPEHSNMWAMFRESLADLQSVTVPRLIARDSDNIILHGFCDASTKGYGAVLYVTDPTGSTLLTSKTRVASIKFMSIPRMELCGALLLAQLASHFVNLLSNYLHPSRTHLWCDSKVVLDWIKIPPYQLKLFVANRVTQILEITDPLMWKYVPSQDNPADLASRGATPSTLIHSTLWWSGPPWLRKPPDEWPQLPPDPVSPDVTRELKPPELTLAVTAAPKPLFDHISSWSRLIRVVSLIIKWKYHKQSLTVTQLYSKARIAICYYVQHTALNSLVTRIHSNLPLTREFSRLNPFIDTDNLVKLNGRLAKLDSYTRPIILPKNHPIVDLLIDHFHVCFAHAGVSFILFELSKQYWIISARQRIRSRVHKCTRCFRARPIDKPPFMADLPLSRISPSLPFTCTGMDYAGPFNVRLHHLRKAPIVKVYLCVFVCFTTRAVHLELVQSLTSAAFIDALRKFISRRGTPAHLYSDRGTNFVGAAAILNRTWTKLLSSEESVLHELAMKKVEFHVNPPAAPHQGGLWERAVGSAKYLISRVLGTQVPTVWQLQALFTRVEGILNSRPLIPMSSDPSDITALTPAHFLIGRPLYGAPEPTFDVKSTNLGTSYQLVQALTHRFWARWRVEYLSQLQVRSKWTAQTPPLQVGDIVVINEPNVPPLGWPLGRIVETFPGSDQVVRSAKVRTGTGEYVRPAVKLYRLPSN